MKGEIPLFITRIIEKHVFLMSPFDEHSSFMPGGQNGPYFDIETPIRNTAHWLINFSIYYQFTGDEQYKIAATRLLNFLLEPKKCKQNGVYVHRQKAGKDWSNGVIGQAWVGEALLISGTILKNAQALEEARSSLRCFEFDMRVKAWFRVDAANGKKAVDYTLNHQLWYAAVKAEVLGQACFDEIDSFLSQLNKDAFKIRKTGLINHLFHSSSLKGRLLGLRYRLLEKRNPEAVQLKEVGYHLFNLYPLARLFFLRPNHPFFSSDKLLAALQFSISENFIKKLQGNKYAYQYNSPAFEMPLILSAFRNVLNVADKDEVIRSLFAIQEAHAYNKSASILANTDDPTTLTSRIYEYLLGLYLQKRFDA